MTLTMSLRATVLALFATATAWGQLVTGIRTGYFNDSSIQTNSFGGGTLVNSFLPDGAKPFGTGRGVEIVGNKIYYTEATGSAFLPGPTNSIRIAPYNQGAGGADITTIPNPRSGYMVQDLDYDSTNSILYVLTGYYWDAVPQVFGLDPLSGAIVRGPINVAVPGRGDIAGPGSADGFTLLPNGNFLINNYTTSCTYNQYDSSTGALIPNTTITLPGINCTGVDTDGAYLYFQTHFDTYTKTTMAGVPVSSLYVYQDAGIYDISVQKGFAGVPHDPNCHGKTVSALTKLYGSTSAAAINLGYPTETDLQNAIWDWCGGK